MNTKPPPAVTARATRKRSPVTDREKFLALLLTGPLLRADAIIVPSGDGVSRLTVAFELFRQNAAPWILLTGGYGNPPFSITAEGMVPSLMALGVSIDRIMAENKSQNTWEQAVNVTAIAVEQKWKRLLLVASPFHTARAFLTFLKAIQDAGKEDEIRLVSVPASHLSWWDKPEGKDETRLDLLAEEYGKIEVGQEKGHCADYRSALAYLRSWEGR